MKTESDPCSPPTLKPACPTSGAKSRLTKTPRQKLDNSPDVGPAQADVRTSVVIGRKLDLEGVEPGGVYLQT